jgi:hypothetical protein
MSFLLLFDVPAVVETLGVVHGHSRSSALETVRRRSG